MWVSSCFLTSSRCVSDIQPENYIFHNLISSIIFVKSSAETIKPYKSIFKRNKIYMKCLIVTCKRKFRKVETLFRVLGRLMRFCSPDRKNCLRHICFNKQIQFDVPLSVKLSTMLFFYLKIHNILSNGQKVPPAGICASNPISGLAYLMIYVARSDSYTF